MHYLHSVFFRQTEANPSHTPRHKKIFGKSPLRQCSMKSGHKYGRHTEATARRPAEQPRLWAPFLADLNLQPG